MFLSQFIANLHLQQIPTATCSDAVEIRDTSQSSFMPDQDLLYQSQAIQTSTTCSSTSAGLSKDIFVTNCWSSAQSVIKAPELRGN